MGRICDEGYCARTEDGGSINVSESVVAEVAFTARELDMVAAAMQLALVRYGMALQAREGWRRTVGRDSREPLSPDETHALRDKLRAILEASDR